MPQKMKRIFFYLIFLSIGRYAYGQLQHGYVKTRGRIVSGQLVPGQRLSGATITITGNQSYVSNEKGNLSFAIPSDKTFCLLSARKNGYTLADPDALYRTWTYSKQIPFVVIMEDEARLRADINEATRKVRRTLTAQLQKQEEEIEALRQQQCISEMEYQDQLEKLYNNQTKTEQLVKEMAERYARTDYDQLDDFNRKVQMYIEEGELLKADSMIQSKGKLEKRISDYKMVREAAETTRKQLEKTEAGLIRTYADLAQDLYSKATIALSRLQHEEAMGYMKARADLDTTNWKAAYEYVRIALDEERHSQAEEYGLLSLRHIQDVDNHKKEYSDILFSLGRTYNSMDEYAKSEEYLNLSIDIYRKLYDSDPETYGEGMFLLLNSLCVLYKNSANYSKAEEWGLKALGLIEGMYKRNPEQYRYSFSLIHNNLGALYENMDDFKKSEEFYRIALEQRQILYQQKPDEYRADLYVTFYNLGVGYYRTKNYTSCQEHLEKALELCKKSFNENPDAHRPHLALIYNMLGSVCKEIMDFKSAEDYFMHSIQQYEDLTHQSPKAFLGILSSICNNLAVTYFTEGKYHESEKYYRIAIVHYEKLFLQKPEAMRNRVAEVYNMLAYLCFADGRYDEALLYSDKCLDLTPENAIVYDTRGEILLAQEKTEQALEVWHKMLQLEPAFAEKHAKESTFYQNLKKRGLIE